MSDKHDAGAGHNAPRGLAANDVITAYRLFFGRDPENEDVILSHIARNENLEKFRVSIFNSAEFKAKFSGSLPAAPVGSEAPVGKSMIWPAIKVDVDVSDAQLSEMVRFVEGNWEALGRAEPHWSVLTSDEFKAANIEQNKEQFYQSGKRSLDFMTSAMARCGLAPDSFDTCLELGCGVGRVTIWLAQRFRVVTGVDISRPHIALAEAAAEQRMTKNISFMHINSLESLRELPNFDCLYSVIVLQHNPPPVIKAILDMLLTKLTPGGVAYFQVPTYAVGYRFDADAYLASAEVRGVMEVHVLPQPALFSLFNKHGCRVLEVREDGWTGSNRMISNSLLIQKRN